MTLPSAEWQIEFLKYIQNILQAGSFTSTYKCALLIALSNVAIEKGSDTDAPLTIRYRDLAEQFIQLYWHQARPYKIVNQTEIILAQNTGNTIAIMQRIDELQARYTTLANARRQSDWNSTITSVAQTVKKMPAQYLQNIGGQTYPFLYEWSSKGMEITLKRGVMYGFRQFNGIITQLAEHKWLQLIRQNSQNAELFQDDHDLYTFLFETSRQALGKVKDQLIPLQNNCCFYCGKPIKENDHHVDHFIPWSLYSSDTGHNFVLSDSRCNLQKSDALASLPVLERWLERNELRNHEIIEAITPIGFICDKERSHNVAKWAYSKLFKADSFFWVPPKTLTRIVENPDLTFDAHNAKYPAP